MGTGTPCEQKSGVDVCGCVVLVLETAVVVGSGVVGQVGGGLMTQPDMSSKTLSS